MQVHDFFVELSEGLGFSRDRVAMVPGNHDINWLKCHAYFLDCEGDGTEPVEPYWPKLEPYAGMFQRFYRGVEGVGFPKDQPWTVFEIAELKTVIAGLNSTMAESHRNEDHYGWCGEEQLRSVAARLQSREREGWLRIGVIHHNPVITSGEDTAYLSDNRMFEEFIAPHLNLLMHGHTHEGRICSTGPDGLPVLCAGSAGVRQSARADDIPNQYQVVQITADGLHVRARRYNPGRSRWEGDTSVGRQPEESHRDIQVWLRQVEGVFPPDSSENDPKRSHNAVDLDARLRAEPHPSDPDDLLARVNVVCQVRHPSAQVEVVEVSGPLPSRYLRVTEPGEPHVNQYPIGIMEGTPNAA